MTTIVGHAHEAQMNPGGVLHDPALHDAAIAALRDAIEEERRRGPREAGATEFDGGDEEVA